METQGIPGRRCSAPPGESRSWETRGSPGVLLPPGSWQANGIGSKSLSEENDRATLGGQSDRVIRASDRSGVGGGAGKKGGHGAEEEATGGLMHESRRTREAGNRGRLDVAADHTRS